MIAEGLIRGEDGLDRCFWHGGLEDYRRYHDEEWGQPVTDDIRLF
ncbi:MAG: DNA-3-methyladenine glycosylase I, partial [Pseudomonadota bacterium]|nr:DNA-3-methyladenine glycosylase I [Pseudomonadota bacterium]